MSEQRENRTAWEAALKGLDTPPLSGSWKAMEGLLDREMPVRPPRSGRRWLLLLLLLLLIGVCNRYRGGVGHRTQTARSAGAPGAAAAAGSSGAEGQAGHVRPMGAATPATQTAHGAAGADVGAEVTGDLPMVGGAATKKPGEAAETKTAMADTARAGAKADTVRADTAAAARADTVKMAAAKAKTGKSKKMAEPYKGITAGVGLNQFFPVGQQVQSSFNSSGTNGTITDYLPVPQLRYYFSRKLYIEGEAQFNTPQYTSKNLLANQQLQVDSTGVAQSSAVYIKKLFYFNLPVSVHYSPVKGLYLGAGLQYAKLTNGVADFSQSKGRYNGTTYAADSVFTTKVTTFKGDSIYRKLRTYEWRLLGDVCYQWMGFTLGVRYNWALNKFINLQVSGAQVTQARNSSMQLYLRYTIWRQRSLRKSPK